MQPIPYLVQLSKSLSWLLRHGVVKEGLNMSPDGYVLCDDIIKLKKFKKCNFENIKTVVEQDNKQRYKLKYENDKWYIRANQGHSTNVGTLINEEKLLTKLTEPLDRIVHGTPMSAYEIIKTSGLKKLKRTHIHFAISDDFIEGNKEQRGIRKNCEILIYLNMKLAMDDGIEFFMSDNKVVLSKGMGDEGIISTKYFSKVVNKTTGEIIG